MRSRSDKDASQEKERGSSMPMFVALVNWTEQGTRNLKETVGRTDAFIALAGKMECKVHNFLYTMGPHDIVAVIEAPNDRAASALILSVQSLGNVRGVTMPAFTKEEMAGILRDVR